MALKDKEKSWYQGNGQVKDLNQAKKVTWIYVSDKPLPNSQKKKIGKCIHTCKILLL